MTLMEYDLLAALKELQEASEDMTSGRRLSSDEMVRYKQAVEWAKRVIALAESGNNFLIY